MGSKPSSKIIGFVVGDLRKGSEPQKTTYVAPPAPTDQSDVTKLVNALQSVNTNNPEAKLNKTSISDGKGGRIEMNDQILNQTFKGVEPRIQTFKGIDSNKK